METLKRLYEIHSPSRGEKRMRKYLRRYIKGVCPDAVIRSDNSGNMYITRGVSDTYPCVVAHLDQVQHYHSGDFEVVQSTDALLGFSKSSGRTEGLGADDKNGIWIALQCLERYKVMKVAFFVGEEIGCVGSSAADMEFFKDCRFVLQCDRRGGYDLITNASGVALCSREFVDSIQPQEFGYSETQGLMTDVMQLKENGLEVSAVNISCGYYNPHTDTEFTVISELLNCRDFVLHIIETCTDTYPHDYVPSWGYFGRYSTKDNWHSEDMEACASDMAYWLYENPDTTFRDFFAMGYQDIYGLTEDELAAIYDEIVCNLQFLDEDIESTT